MQLIASLLRCVAFSCATAAAHAQCSHTWLLGDGVPGASANVSASVRWDPDGPGPATEVVVFGGAFTMVASTAANRIAAWDPATGQWSTFGSGMDMPVYALAVLPNGELVAGGEFTTAGGVPANRVARWNGSAWSPLGSGVSSIGSLSNHVSALLALPNGDVIAGGFFTAAGSSCIARWDGTTWNPMGAGVTYATGLPRVLALTRLPNGDVLAGGLFTTAGGIAANNVARWDGTAWSALGSGTSHWVWAFAVMPNGDVIAGGQFTDAGGVAANNVARWDGTAWSALGTGVAHFSLTRVYSLTPLANGELLVGGHFSIAGGLPANGIARWSAGTWSTLGTGLLLHPLTWSPIGAAFTMVQLPNGSVVIGGAFDEAGSLPAHHVARWDGAAWSPLAAGANGSVHAMLRLPGGDLLAGGAFTSIGGVQAHRIARWNGTSWSPLGGGIGTASGSGTVLALARLPNGDIVAAGGFDSAGGAAANNIARWDGTSWSPLGSGMSSGVTCVAAAPNGDVFAGGSFVSAGGVTVNGIARWDGTSWQPLGTGIGGVVWLGLFIPGPVRSIVVQPNGDVIAAGAIPSAGGVPVNNVARWNGSAWLPLAGGVGVGAAGTGGVFDLAVLANGDLVAAEYVTIHRWNGTSWSSFGTSMQGNPLALMPLPNGHLDVATSSGAGVPTGHIARWNGASWSTIGGSISGVVESLARTADDQLAVGGTFLSVGGQPSAHWARLATTCPASAAPYGSGCAGSAGPVTLATTTLPWLGTTFTALATGIPSNALALGVYGIGPVALSLAAILPQGVPGCSLLASPDFWSVHLPVAGTVQTTLPVPTSIALVAATFVHQAVVFEFGPTGDIVAVTSSNGLAQTLGAL